jgi:alkyldihydroxyacetonephosphate synthase
MMSAARLKHYGWGREGEGMTPQEGEFILGLYKMRFGRGDFEVLPVPRLEDLNLREPRIAPPASLAAICSAERYDRAAHTYGKSYPDYVRAMLGDYGCAPDVVAYPRNESEISAVMDWAGSAGASLAPFGGGSSVCGGVEHRIGGVRYKAAITLDMRNLGKVAEVDSVSRAALIEAGAYGPSLEEQLKPHGMTLRHFPQSFEYSTLGGWIATRSGGHFASLYTHIDDFVESLRVVTPKGVLETRRLPGSGAGPSPDRMFIGSEGTLGVISRAWMRVQPRPKFRAGSSVRFKTFFDAARAVRAIAQAGLYPSNCRILDPNEARNTGAADGSAAIMVLAFESGDHPLDAWIARALECCADHGGAPEPAKSANTHREGAAGAWRNAFIRMPFAREFTVPAGIISDTFETAITWERFESFHDAVKAAAEHALETVTGVKGQVTCSFTHVYPDGPAPYFTFHALGRHGALLEQWRAIKDAKSGALIAAGGSITHHHAVGRDHRKWYDMQRPELFADALRAAKQALDPAAMLNPGVLIDP